MKPVLLGMNNPHSHRPEHALWPYPPGCTGHRVLRLLQSRLVHVTHEEYLRAFDRVNLWNSRVWDDAGAIRAVPGFVKKYRGREVLVLGSLVRDVIGLRPELVHPQDFRGITWRQLPHPSGRCPWYNDQRNRVLAAVLLQELYERSAA